MFYVDESQVDVDAALVEAERVGQACSRQFPSCSVSRIDILRLAFVKRKISNQFMSDLQGLQGSEGHFLQHAYAVWVVGRGSIDQKVTRIKQSIIPYHPNNSNKSSHCFLN